MKEKMTIKFLEYQLKLAAERERCKLTEQLNLLTVQINELNHTIESFQEINPLIYSDIL
jgi:DNA-directed RNA polymerase specialized sigma54-like protein